MKINNSKRVDKKEKNEIFSKKLTDKGLVKASKEPA